MKGRALRRALDTNDALRVNASVPLITDTTELITPEIAHAMLKHNRNNRPINWNKVGEYSDAMTHGDWQMHAQGIVLDPDGNILTGQKRLWAVVYSGVNVYMRVSRGNPPESAKLLDRGTPQTARDLASRGSGRKHSPVEASIARGYCALMGNTRPSTDVLGITIEVNADTLQAIVAETKGGKKSRAALMVLSAICRLSNNAIEAKDLARHVDPLAALVEDRLAPQTAAKCWGRGAAFGLAMDVARVVVEEFRFQKG